MKKLKQSKRVLLVCAILHLFLYNSGAQTLKDNRSSPRSYYAAVGTEVFAPMQSVFPYGNQKLHIEYTDNVFPGDAVFICFNLKDGTLKNARAELIRDSDGKILSTALFYAIGETKKYIALLPLSSWYKAGLFRLSLSYTVSGKREEKLMLSLTMSAKEFASETIYLNARNAAIKTDTSKKRLRQIARLNEILNTINYSAVYHKGCFCLPVNNTRRTAFFADRRIFTYLNGKSSTSLHLGIDFGVPENTAVFSCGNGKVVLTENRVSTGYSVVIEHLPGLYSLYYHLNSYCVQEGDQISRGQKIGLSGATGLATGPHLHWEVRLLGQAVNPDLFVRYFPIKE